MTSGSLASSKSRRESAVAGDAQADVRTVDLEGRHGDQIGVRFADSNRVMLLASAWMSAITASTAEAGPVRVKAICVVSRWRVLDDRQLDAARSRASADDDLLEVVAHELAGGLHVRSRHDRVSRRCRARTAVRRRLAGREPRRRSRRPSGRRRSRRPADPARAGARPRGGPPRSRRSSSRRRTRCRRRGSARRRRRSADRARARSGGRRGASRGAPRDR